MKYKSSYSSLNKSSRLVKARDMLLAGDIDPTDYRVIKSECEHNISRLEAKLAEATNISTTVSIDKIIEKAVSSLSQLDVLYTKADVNTKREIISSIYPEKLSFDGIQYRTVRINEAARLIYQISNELGSIKNRKGHDLRTFPVG